MSSLQPPQQPACGGERALGSVAGGIIFLSRLRGGELFKFFNKKELNFLSRLRGGELVHAVVAADFEFLRRLRGGEP